MLPSGSAVLYSVPHVQLCVLPEHVRTTQRTNPETVATMLETQFFLLPQRVPNEEHGDSGNHGNQSVNSTLCYIQGDC